MRDEIYRQVNPTGSLDVARVIDQTLKLAEELTVVVINDGAMAQCMEDDLQNNYNYTVDEATEWIEEYGEKVVDCMWDAYGQYFQDNVEYKG